MRQQVNGVWLEKQVGPFYCVKWYQNKTPTEQSQTVKSGISVAQCSSQTRMPCPEHSRTFSASFPADMKECIDLWKETFPSLRCPIPTSVHLDHKYLLTTDWQISLHSISALFIWQVILSNNENGKQGEKDIESGAEIRKINKFIAILIMLALLITASFTYDARKLYL